MRVIIAGGRNFDDYKTLESQCHGIFKQLSDEGRTSPRIDDLDIEIVSGKARGADSLGERFARQYGINVKEFPAKWMLYGKSAGYKRNEEMAKYAKENNGVLIAFWDGVSKGTKHMIDLAKKYNLDVYIVNY